MMKVSGTVPVAILKLPRTGSSWFTEILNAIPSVYISKEIMQQSDVGKYTPREVEDHLIRALRRPTDKLARRDSWLPSGRFNVDYIQPWKFLHKLDIIGFTLNPLHCSDADYARLAQEIPQMKVRCFACTDTLQG